jgi:hypothetical protein
VRGLPPHLPNLLAYLHAHRPSKTFGKKQIAKTKGMAIGHAFFTRRYSVFSSGIRVQPSADPDSIGLQSLPAAPAKSLISINKIHPTAKPDNYRQTSAKLFLAILRSR